MNKFFQKLFMAVNVFVIRLSRGRLGTHLDTQSILLLHTTGRRSGRQIVTPIAYFFTEGFYFLVGSNWGKPNQAGWYYNLLERPATLIEVQGKNIPVHAHLAQGPEHERLWQYAISHHPPYLHYKEMTSRHIPIVVLTPVA